MVLMGPTQFSLLSLLLSILLFPTKWKIYSQIVYLPLFVLGQISTTVQGVEL